MQSAISKLRPTRPFRAALSVCVLAVGTSGAGAQIRRPSFSADLELGGGARTGHADGIWFRGEEKTPFGRVAIATEYPATSRVRAVLTVDRSGTTEMGDHTSDCPLAPNGACRRYFPTLVGYAATLGLRGTLFSRIDAGVAAGLGSMSGRTKVLDADLALRLSKHVGAVTGLRQIVVNHTSGHRLWWRPISVGVRIQ
jgi:hypothetical protein